MKIRIPTKIRVRVSTLRWVGVLSILSMIALLFMFMSPVTAYAYSDEDSEGQTQPTAATVVDASEDDEDDDDDDDIVTPNITTPNSATPPSTARGSMTDEVQDGTGTVTENSDDAPSGKQFVTIETKSGKIFYMILDYDKAGDNVYLLTEVTENDLLNFVEVEDGTGAAIPGDSTGATTPQIPEDTDPDGDTDPEPEPEPEPEKKSKVGTLLVILLIAGAGCGAYYYFKIKKPKSEPLGSLDDLDFDDDEDDGYPADDGDDDFYLDDEPDTQGDDEE